MNKLKKILKLANPLDNRIRAAKASNANKFFIHNGLAILETLSRGAIVGGTVSYLVTGGTDYIVPGIFIGSVCDITQHALRLTNLTYLRRKGELNEHLKRYTWRSFE